MSLSIPSSVPAAYDASRASATAAATSPAQARTTPKNPPFVIKLTDAEQAYQLNLQGQTVPQIADRLSLTAAVVRRYLGITNST